MWVAVGEKERESEQSELATITTHKLQQQQQCINSQKTKL